MTFEQVLRYLNENKITDLGKVNFSFNWRVDVKLSEKRVASKLINAFGYRDRLTPKKKAQQTKRIAKYAKYTIPFCMT